MGSTDLMGTLTILQSLLGTLTYLKSLSHISSICLLNMGPLQWASSTWGILQALDYVSLHVSLHQWDSRWRLTAGYLATMLPSNHMGVLSFLVMILGPQEGFGSSGMVAEYVHVSNVIFVFWNYVQHYFIRAAPLLLEVHAWIAEECITSYISLSLRPLSVGSHWWLSG